MKNLRCYAKINTKNLLHNFECIRSLVADGCEIIPIIKANAYSHGAVEFARALCQRVSTFAVAEMDEALALRESGIKNDILVLGYTDPSFATLLSDNKITQTVTDTDYARQLSDRLGGMTLNVHIKLDTGMHRFGFDCDSPEAVQSICDISKLDGIKITGTFSHFAESDSPNSDFTNVQLARFKSTIEKLNANGVDTGVLHIANSAATLCRPDSHFSAVRPGIILYGAYPSQDTKKAYLEAHPDKPLREVMTMCARVGQVHRAKAGETVGYSRNYTLCRDSVIATVTAGYADGIPRALSNKGRVVINGEAFNIIGNVCMDLLMVDITDAKNAIKAGDEVIFWGENGIPVAEYAELSDTISYTLYTGVSPRVTRIYE